MTYPPTPATETPDWLAGALATVHKLDWYLVALHADPTYWPLPLTEQYRRENRLPADFKTGRFLRYLYVVWALWSQRYAPELLPYPTDIPWDDVREKGDALLNASDRARLQDYFESLKLPPEAYLIRNEDLQDKLTAAIRAAAPTFLYPTSAHLRPEDLQDFLRRVLNEDEYALLSQLESARHWENTGNPWAAMLHKILERLTTAQFVPHFVDLAEKPTDEPPA